MKILMFPSNDNGENGTPFYHELDKSFTSELQKKEFRKQVNREAWQSVQGSCHESVKLIVHRPEATEQNRKEYHQVAASLMPVIQELIRKTNSLLEHEVSTEFSRSQLYGTKFCGDQAASSKIGTNNRKVPVSVLY